MLKMYKQGILYFVSTIRNKISIWFIKYSSAEKKEATENFSFLSRLDLLRICKVGENFRCKVELFLSAKCILNICNDQ